MKRKVKIPLWLIAAVCALSILLLLLPIRKQNDYTAGWGDNGGGRRSYTHEEIKAGVLDDKVVFNSVSDGLIGDEKNFVGARLDTDADSDEENVWDGNEITVQNGAIYIIRAFVHNNSMLGYDGSSHNTKIAFNIPTEAAASIPVHGFIFSDNAMPSECWDGVLFTSDSKFHLEYQQGSALLENGGVGAGGLPLSDEIVTRAESNNGTLIGYDALDGDIPGGEQYASFVTIRVRAVFESDHSVEQCVRIDGDDKWRTTVEAQVGDVVEFQIQYKNIGERDHSNVMVKDILPDNLEYIAGSTRLYNALHENGAGIDQDDLVTNAINIGNYASGANAFVRFKAKVVDINLRSGTNTLVNWSQCGVGQVTLQDYTSITIHKSE